MWISRYKHAVLHTCQLCVVWVMEGRQQDFNSALNWLIAAWLHAGTCPVTESETAALCSFSENSQPDLCWEMSQQCNLNDGKIFSCTSTSFIPLTRSKRWFSSLVLTWNHILCRQLLQCLSILDSCLWRPVWVLLLPSFLVSLFALTLVLVWLLVSLWAFVLLISLVIIVTGNGIFVIVICITLIITIVVRALITLLVMLLLTVLLRLAL